MMEKLFNMWTFFVLVLIIVHLNLSSAQYDQGEKKRVRRQYYVCPPKFKRISSNCYYFSDIMATWQDAHYDCRDKDSQLAVLLTSAEDQKLRSQLNKPSVTPLEWWIGGIYDWEQMQWKWGASAKKLEYQGFSRMEPENKEKLKWHCIILDPSMKYKWSARSCVHGKHYICQKKVSRVGEKGLRKLKAKYNVNENNQLNEIPIPMNFYDKPLKRRGHNHENQSNGHAKTGLKNHDPGFLYDTNSVNAFAHRKNSTELRAARRRERNNKDKKRRRERKNRKNKNKHLQSHIRNGTDHGLIHSELGYGNDKHKNRNRRNKSKENNSAENTNMLRSDDFKINKHKHHHRILKDSSMEAVTQKTTYLSNTISPLYPRVIVEEHDFPDIN